MMSSDRSHELPPLPDPWEGDSKLFRDNLERNLPWIMPYVSKRLGTFRRSKADTGDILQETLIQFLKWLRYVMSKLMHNEPIVSPPASLMNSVDERNVRPSGVVVA